MTDSFFGQFKEGFKDRYGEGREDYRQAYYAAREMQGLDQEDVRIKTTFATEVLLIDTTKAIKLKDITRPPRIAGKPASLIIWNVFCL